MELNLTEREYETLFLTIEYRSSRLWNRREEIEHMGREYDERDEKDKDPKLKEWYKGKEQEWRWLTREYNRLASCEEKLATYRQELLRAKEAEATDET